MQNNESSSKQIYTKQNGDFHLCRLVLSLLKSWIRHFVN